MTYTVTEGDTMPSIRCTASCRPQCTLMWTGPNFHDGSTNDLYLQNIKSNQKGTFYCTATNEVGSKVSSSVVVDVRCKLLYLSFFFCLIMLWLSPGFEHMEQKLLTFLEHLSSRLVAIIFSCFFFFQHKKTKRKINTDPTSSEHSYSLRVGCSCFL